MENGDPGEIGDRVLHHAVMDKRKDLELAIPQHHQWAENFALKMGLRSMSLNLVIYQNVLVGKSCIKYCPIGP